MIAGAKTPDRTATVSADRTDADTRTEQGNEEI
jgi:hypothetical protein